MKKCTCGYHLKGAECFACGKTIEVIHKEPKIKPIGKSMAEKLKEYSKKRKKFLAENPRCAVFPNLPSVEVHHKKGRAGDLLLDETYWLAVSEEGHRKIHDYPLFAVENGFKILRSQK